ncbi:MAG: shikimate kinase [Bacteroidia bacterium]
MGAGKTTLGRAAAGLLGWTFADLDAWIEAAEGRSVPAIFAEEGQDYFRAQEAAAIEALGQEAPLSRIVATGGGAACFGDNMTRMNALGLTIYLKPDLHTLCDRLRDQRAGRPLLRDLTDAQLLPFLEAMQAQREPYYARARYTLSGGDLTPQGLAACIRAAVG